MELLWQDLRFGLRSLTKSRAQTAILLGLVVLGASSAIAVFVFTNAALLRPLPYPDAERLVLVSEAHPRRGSGSGLRPANFLDWKSDNEIFASATASFHAQAELTTDEGLELVSVQLVLEDYFEAFGVSPELGRPFGDEDFAAHYPRAIDWDASIGRVAVVSHRFWQQRYGASPDALGASLRLNEATLTIIGVMPPSFQALGGSRDVWIPWVLSAEERANRATHVFFGLGRLKPDVGITEARAEMKRIYRDLEELHPAENAGWTADVESIRDVILGDTRSAILILQGGALVVLLVAGINVAAILGARAVAREDDFRLIQALGATRGRVVRQILGESLLLGLAGGGLALVALAATISLLTRIPLPTALPFELKPALDTSVVLLGLGVSAAAGLLFGIAPAFRAAHSAGPLVPKSRPRRSREVIIICQAALAMALTSSGGLLLRSLAKLDRAELGFEPAPLLVTTVYRPRKYESVSEQRQFQSRLLEEARSLYGVDHAAVALYAPFSPITMNLRFDIEGRDSESTDSFNARAQVVSQDYFQTIGATLLRGRGFGDEDTSDAPGAVIIDETLAREYWPGQNPVGQRLEFPYPVLDRAAFTVVGVVRDVTHSRLAVEPERTLYLTPEQSDGFFEEMNLLLRSPRDPEGNLRALRTRLHALDPDIVIGETRLMLEAARQELRPPRVRTGLMASFASVALLLAGCGVYGLVAHAVAERRREIGIRVALGARPRQIESLLTSRAAGLAVAGAALGLPLAFFGMRSFGSLLYGISPAEPTSYIVAAALVWVASLAGSYLPARRAGRLAPAPALKSE